MAYVEVRKEGKLVMQKQVDDELAQKGFRIRVGTAGNVFLKLGEMKTVGDYVVTLYKGQPSEDAYHAVDDLKKAVGAILPINTPNAQNVTVSADAGDAVRAGEQKKYPQIEGFEITGRLGEGGMGTVWRGVQLSTKRQVAIKFLSTHRFTSEKAKTRFEREVAIAAKLNHPNIAQVYDSGVHRGVYYYAMELIEGIHLDKYVQREELSPKEIMKLMRDVCDAVCHAHQHGIIHRDLKPSNILVTPFGKPTIVDFGLAKSFENEHEDATISIEGDITGTPAYMSPEQAAGHVKDISERTDVYAMGVIMYQLAAGCLPHDISGSHYDIFRRIVEEDVISSRTINPAIDNELDSILLTCLAREPENRYPSASVLVKDIDNYLSGEPLLSKSFSTTYRVVKQFHRNRFKIALGGIFAAMLTAIILLLCFIYSSLSPDGPTKSTAQQNSTERIINPNQSLTANKGSQPKAGEVIANNPLRPKEVDKTVVEQNPPLSFSLQRNQPPAAISINDKPFFVICARNAVPEEFEEYKKAGFNTVYTHLSADPALDEAQKHGLYAIHNFADYKCKDGLFLPEFWQEAEQQTTRWNNHPALLGWMQSSNNFQGRLNSSEIQRLYNLLDAKNPRKLKLLLYGFDENNWKQIYPYNDYTDVAVLENWSILENIPATTVWFEHALELAKKRPMWYIVPANSRIWEKLSFPLAKIRSIAYLGINHGATGILVDGFQNQLWAEWMKAYKRDNISGLADLRLADLRREAIRVAGELKTLSPAILAGSLKDSSKLSGNSQIDFQAFADPENTTLYFIAVNLSSQITTSSFFIPDGLQDSIEVMNEGRTLQQINSQFSDSFEPQETHIYILKTGMAQTPQAESAATNLVSKPQQETTPPEKWHKAMEDARREFLSINDRESADFVGTILDSLDKPQGMSPSALTAYANRLESKTRELVRKGALESAAIHNYAMWSARYVPGPGADALARAGQLRRNNSPSRADGLVLYMPFDTPPVNSMVRDESGTGNHGKLEGAQWVSEGHFGGAYRFRITNLTDRILIPDSDSLNPQKVTVAAWIKTPDTDGFWNRIVDKDFRKGYVLCLGGDFNGKRDRGKLGFEANSKYIPSDQPLGDDRWHHVAGTFDGMTIKLYVDGVEKKQTPKNSKPIAGNHWDLCIGNSIVDYGTGEFLGFDGLIDEVRVYNRVLSADEIQTLTSASQAEDIASPASPAGDNTSSTSVLKETSQPLPKQELAAESKIWSKRNPSPAAITVEGKPYFVICARSAVPEEFEEYKQAGINTVETNLPSNPALDEAKIHGLYAIHRFADYKCKEGLFLPEFWQETQENITTWKSHPALLAWDQSADLLTPYKNPSEIKKIFDILSVKSPEKLKLLSYDFNDDNWKLFYQYNAYCDVVVLDNFPIRKNIPATALWFQRAFQLAGGKPVWYTVHANIWRDESPSVREFRTSTYLGINHGATGILIDGFQSRLWGQWMDAYKINDGFGMADPRLASLRREALRLAGELKTLSPAILAGSIKEETELFDNQQLDCRAFADPQNSTLYIISVNPSDQLAVSSFHVPQGMENPIEVLNENRTIEHKAGEFTDAFEQNETHIYICKYPQKNALNPDSNS